MLPLRNLLKTRIIPATRINVKKFCAFDEVSKQLPRVATDVDYRKKLIMSHYPSFVEEMKAIVGSYGSLSTTKHLERVLDYNVLGGKKNRVQMVVESFEELAPRNALTEANSTLSVYLGWCLEVFHGFYIIVDDIMDESETRRGQLCWYRNDDVKMAAVNDSFLLEAVTYSFLEKHFGHLKCYEGLLKIFQQLSLIITIGEHMDLVAVQQDVLTFTMEQFRKIATYKTSDYFIYVPIELAYNLAGYSDLHVLQNAKELLYEIGIFLQIQDDFLDCYGDPDVTGKVGTDIQDGKCTWLVVSFLDRATEAQKAALKEVYGRKDEESVQRVKQLYEEVDLRRAFMEYEEEAYSCIKQGIQQQKGIPRKHCQHLMDKLYKRNF